MQLEDVQPQDRGGVKQQYQQYGEKSSILHLKKNV
jgi:hypothetical protein